MTAETVPSNIPDGVALPLGIRSICEYLDEQGYPISGCFEITTSGKTMQRHGLAEMQSFKVRLQYSDVVRPDQFMPFGWQKTETLKKLQRLFSDLKVTLWFWQKNAIQLAVC